MKKKVAAPKIVMIECKNCINSRENKEEFFCITKMKDTLDYSNAAKVSTVPSCSFYKLK